MAARCNIYKTSTTTDKQTKDKSVARRISKIDGQKTNARLFFEGLAGYRSGVSELDLAQFLTITVTKWTEHPSPKCNFPPTPAQITGVKWKLVNIYKMFKTSTIQTILSSRDPEILHATFMKKEQSFQSDMDNSQPF